MEDLWQGRGKAAVKSRQLDAIPGADDAASPYVKALLEIESQTGIPCLAFQLVDKV